MGCTILSLIKFIITIRLVAIKKHVTGLFGVRVVLTKLYEKNARFPKTFYKSELHDD